MDNCAEIKLEGHLTGVKLNAVVAPVSKRIAATNEKIGLIIDCRTMSGYESEARVAFVDWNRAHKTKIRRVAIVTSNKLWHMVVAAMSLASGQPMQAFDELGRAETWAREG